VARLFKAGDHVPLIPFVEVVGSAANAAPEQIGATCVNAGVMLEFTAITIVLVVAHCPGFGVKVYVVVAVLFSAGDQVPVMPFVEVIGSATNATPEQIGATCVNAGVTFEFTVITIVMVVAHCPTFGVKVYVVVAVLLIAGDHVPLIPLVEVVGSAANVAPEQIGATCVNAGATLEFTVITIVLVVAHCPAFGVKVYVVVAVLLIAGDHVPVIPFVEVVGSAANAAPEQIGATCVNAGVRLGFTVITMVVATAH